MSKVGIKKCYSHSMSSIFYQSHLTIESPLQKPDQHLVQLIFMREVQTVGASAYNLVLVIGDQFGGLVTRGFYRYDIIGVTVYDQCGYVDILTLVAEVGTTPGLGGLDSGAG